MRTCATFAWSLAIYGATVSSQAADPADQELAACESELREYFGKDTLFNVVKRQRHMHGTSVTVAARLDEDNSRFATCWVDRNDSVALETESPEVLDTPQTDRW